MSEEGYLQLKLREMKDELINLSSKIESLKKEGLTPTDPTQLTHPAQKIETEHDISQEELEKFTRDNPISSFKKEEARK